MEKLCSQCGQLKAFSEFYTDKRTSTGCKAECKKCFRARGREQHLKVSYGITQEQYNDMLEVQEFACAICGHKDTMWKINLCVDHDHSTGKVRGLLCDPCNTAIGHLKDDPEIISKALAYVRYHKEH